MRVFDPQAKAKGKLGKKSLLPVRVGINTQGFHLVNAETNVREINNSIKCSILILIIIIDGLGGR